MIVKLFHCIVCKYSSHVKNIQKLLTVRIFVVRLSYIWREGPVIRKSPFTVLAALVNRLCLSLPRASVVRLTDGTLNHKITKQ